MRELVAAVLLCSFTLFSSTVLAQDKDSGKQNYFGITIGQALPGKLDSYDKYPGHVSLSDVDLKIGSMLGVRVGHIPKRFAKVGQVGIVIELEAFLIDGTDDKGDEVYYMRDWAPVYFDADISVIAMMLNFLARDPYGRAHPYGGVGMGWAQFAMKDVELSVRQPYWTLINSQGDVDDDTFAFQLRLGVGYDLTRTLALDFGYYYLRTEPRFHFTKEGWADLDVKMTYQTHMFTVGLNFRF